MSKPKKYDRFSKDIQYKKIENKNPINMLV